MLTAAEAALAALKAQPVNLALNKGITGPADGGWEISGLVNGVIEGEPGWGVTQNTSLTESPIVVTIDLGEAKDFTTVRMYPRNFWASEVRNFPNDYKIEVSTDNAAWKTVYETTDGPVPSDVHSSVDVKLPRTANGQYVRITITAANVDEYSDKWVIQMSELEIYNIAIEGEEAIEAVEEKIAAIGTVTLSSEAAITTARAAYDALSDEQKALVANYDVLTAAEAAFAQLEEDNADPTENIALNKVVTGPAKDSGWSIDRLVDGDISGSTDDWNLGWGVEQGSSFADSPVTIVIDLARARLFNTFKIYPRDAFFSQVQNFPIAYTISVSNDNSAWTKVYETDNGPIPADVNTPAVVTLDDVARARYVKITFTGINRQESGSKWELQLNELEIYYIKRDAAVEAVEDLIDAIGTVTLNSEDAITAARNAYDALDAAKRAEVNNYALLTAAEATLKSLKDAKAAEDVEALIDSIGTVTLASEAQIRAARDAYDALTNEQKNLVDNYDTLVAAEEALSELRKDEYAKPGNIAYGNDVSGPSDSGWNADRLVDGITSGDTGNWNLGWGITQDSSFADAPVTLIIDLGAAKAFNTFKIYPRDAFFSEVQNFPTAYTIAVRNGNESWKVVYETTNGPVPADVNTPATLTLDRTANAQYIMITISGINKQEDAAKWAIQLTELEVYSVENANEQAVIAVEALINAIGDVTLESETKIAAAREAYAALTDAQKAMVLNYKILTEAEAKLAWLKTASDSEKAIAKVEALIDGIGEVTMNSESAINAAREAYGALTTEEKLLIRNYEVLTVAETRLAQLKKAAADKTAADAVAELIDAIGTVTLNSEVAIDVARRAYNALTLEQKALVANYSALTKAEVTFAQLKNEPSDIPDTGDHAILAAAVALMFVSTACGVAMVTRRKKNV